MNRLPNEPSDDREKMDKLQHFLGIGERLKDMGVTPEMDRKLCAKALSTITVDHLYEAAGRDPQTMLAMTLSMKDMIEEGHITCSVEDLGHILILLGLGMAKRDHGMDLSAAPLGQN